MSSNNLAVSVRGLGKKYTIAHNANRPTSLREAIGRRLKSPLGEKKAGREAFWALRDVDFDIRKGDILGIIGRNGAGKSTLLKVLSRIVAPTTGTIDLNGRMASLLEVGTGFHPELTGRENIFLNGSILGMSRREVLRNFDEIVAFAEIDRFLDTPVKRYSSGMYVRLAFSVAAHLQPEILIVDEVLAVGDTSFQKKCLGKIEQVSQQDGRTVIFVSHTMAAIEALCSHAIYLEKGRIAREGSARDVVSYYLAHALPQASQATPLRDRVERSGSGAARLVSFHVEDAAGRVVSHVASGQEVTFVLGYERSLADALDKVDVGISVHSRHDLTLFVHYCSFSGETLRVEGGSGQFRCILPKLPLAPGTYQVGARMTAGGEEVDWPLDRVGGFVVEAGDFYGTGRPGVEGSTSFLVDGKWVLR